ncbi:MAG: hypothetical protein J0I99_00560 [Devosia sp.]|uniref:hypothetical protein n=1 Tax=Devosia sp. TaxID=1871048 RepID=UPI001AC27DB4|nr:hypothetical protein [Devosia sp.]MBN9314208.1 hypothetical protein [Devosia sp.]
MSSLHNDLSTWAGKARASGRDRIEITTDLADALAEVVRAAGQMSHSLPPHWHDDATVELQDALAEAEKAR